MKLPIPSTLTKPKSGAGLPRLADQARDAGNQARDAGNHADAARRYEEYLAQQPDDAAIHVQCGHMYKELGSLREAGEHYTAAERLLPGDVDLQIQLGHFYKVSGRLDDAIAAYRKAATLDPQHSDAKQELEIAEAMREASDRERGAAGRQLPGGMGRGYEGRDSLRNIPAERFDQAVARVSETKAYHLLDGLEQRFPDASLGESSIERCMALCAEAGAADTLRRIVRAVLHARPEMRVPLRLVEKCLDLAAQDAGPHRVPLGAQTAMLSAATNIIARQRAIIDELMP